MSNLQDQAAEIQKITREIEDLLIKSGAAPLVKDDEEGGVDDMASQEAPAELPVADAPAPVADEEGPASVDADQGAAEEAVEDIGDMDGHGEEGMDGRHEVELLAADMSDDELMLMLEVLSAEAAARGQGGEEGSDVEGEQAPEESAPEMEAPAELPVEEEQEPEMEKSGVHASVEKDSGKSQAGGQVRDTYYLAGKAKSKALSTAKDQHAKVLGEMKAMKKPDLGKSEDSSDEMKKSIQMFSEAVQAFLAKTDAPAAPAAPQTIIVKQMASNSHQGEALEKSSKPLQKLAKSTAITLLLEKQKAELNAPQKSVSAGMVSDLYRADEAKADEIIAGLQLRGVLPK